MQKHESPEEVAIKIPRFLFDYFFIRGLFGVETIICLTGIETIQGMLMAIEVLSKGGNDDYTLSTIMMFFEETGLISVAVMLVRDPESSAKDLARKLAAERVKRNAKPVLYICGCRQFVDISTLYSYPPASQEGQVTVM